MPFGRSGSTLRAEVRLQAYRLTDGVVHDLRVAIPTGVLRVESVAPDAAVVVVERTFDRMTPGDRVRRLPDPPTASSTETRPATASIPASLVGAASSDAMLGPGDWLFLDAGEAHGVLPGDEYVPAEGDDLLRRGGRIQVVMVQDSVSTARVIGVGDRLLRLGARMRLDRCLR